MIFQRFPLPRAGWPEILLGCALVVVLYSYFFLPSAQWSDAAPATIGTEEYAAMPPKPEGTVMAVFIDGLPFDSSIDPRVMPTFSALRSRGVWGKMIPCAARMTVQCVQTFFNGIDMSLTPPWMLRIPPNPEVEKYFWPHAIRSRGGIFRVASGYNVIKLYGDAVAEYYRYMDKTFTHDDSLPSRLTDMALDFYRNLNGKKADAVLIHLLNIDYAGHQYLPGSPEHAMTSLLVDRELRRIYDALGPSDTLLIFGDHGMNPIGVHNYAKESPTVYLAIGPDFRAGVRHDMDLASLYFFLNVPMRFPFPSWYDGDTPWHTVNMRGDAAATVSLQQAGRGSGLGSDTGHAPLLTFVFGLLFAASAMLLLASMMDPHSLRNRRMICGVVAAVSVMAIVAAVQGVAIIGAVLLAIGTLVYAINGKYIGWRSLSIAGVVVVIGIILGLLYQSFDLSMHTVRSYVWRRINAFEIVMGIGVALWYMRTRYRYSLAVLVKAGVISFALFIMLFHFPSVYQDGFLRHTPLVLLLSWIALWPWFGTSEHRRSRFFPLYRIFLPAIGGLGLWFIISQIKVKVENFVIRWYVHFSRDDVSSSVYLWSALLYVAAVTSLLVRLPWAWWKKLVAGLTLMTLLPLAWGSVPIPAWLYTAALATGWGLLALGICCPKARSVLQLLAFAAFQLPIAGVVEHAPGALFQIWGFWALLGAMLHVSKNGMVGTEALRALFAAFLIIMMPAVLFGFRAVSIDFDVVALWSPKELWLPLLGAAWAAVVAVAGIYRAPGGVAAPVEVSLINGWLLLRVIMVSLIAFASWHVSDGHRLGIDAIEEAMYIVMFAGFAFVGLGINQFSAAPDKKKGISHVS